MKMRLAFLAAMIGLSASARADHSFTRVVDSSGTFAGFGDAAINNSGTVAFTGEFRGGGSGVYTGRGGALTTIIDPAGLFNPSGRVAINDSGRFAFDASVPARGVRGVFTGSGGAVTTIADSSGQFGSFYVGSINASGTTSFYANLDGGGRGIYSGAGGAVTTIADSSGRFYNFGAVTAINNSGAVAFLGTRSANGRDIDGIYTGAGGATTRIAGDVGFSGFGFPSINNSGTVAFVGPDLVHGRFGVYTGTGGALTTILDDGFGFGNPSINDSGVVAFTAVVGGSLGIFEGSGSGIKRVIGTGDALDGSTISFLSFGQSGFNNAGQVSFRARLADGREGIYVETLRAVPEPTSLTLSVMGLAALGIVLRGRRGRCSG